MKQYTFTDVNELHSTLRFLSHLLRQRAGDAPANVESRSPMELWQLYLSHRQLGREVPAQFLTYLDGAAQQLLRVNFGLANTHERALRTGPLARQVSEALGFHGRPGRGGTFAAQHAEVENYQIIAICIEVAIRDAKFRWKRVDQDVEARFELGDDHAEKRRQIAVKLLGPTARELICSAAGFIAAANLRVDWSEKGFLLAMRGLHLALITPG